MKRLKQERLRLSKETLSSLVGGREGTLAETSAGAGALTGEDGRCSEPPPTQRNWLCGALFPFI
jgi:hypothetical protein